MRITGGNIFVVLQENVQEIPSVKVSLTEQMCVCVRIKFDVQ